MMLQAVTALVNPGDTVLMEVPVYAWVPIVYSSVSRIYSQFKWSEPYVPDSSMRYYRCVYPNPNDHS